MTNSRDEKPREFFCFAFIANAWLIVRLAGVVGYPSGQRGQTVNLLAMPSMVRIHHLPPFFARSAAETKNAAPKSREADEGGPVRRQNFELRPGWPPSSFFDYRFAI